MNTSRKIAARRRLIWAAGTCLFAAGCSHLPPSVEMPPVPPVVCHPLPMAEKAIVPRPQEEPQLIDLATALRLADAKNPEIAFARERINEALAVQQNAEVLWLPHLEINPNWLRHDGQIQRFNGIVETVSRSSLAVTGGPSLNFDWSDALFAKLASRRITEARQAGAVASSNNVFLDVAVAYTDLLQSYAELRVVDDTIDFAQKLYDLMVAYEKTGKAPAADVARAKVELKGRERERIAIQGRIRVISARVAELALLPPATPLRPVETALTPLIMVPENLAVDDLIVHGLRHRPELAEHRAYVEASLERWRAAKFGPWVPELRVIYNGGGYGGGPNSYFSNFSWRGDGGAMAYWRLDNLGFGNQALIRERHSQFQQTNFRVMALENSIAAQIAAARGQADALGKELTSAREAVEAAKESGTLNYDRIRRAPDQGRPIELLQAIQAFQRARMEYVQTVADYNRAQFRLYTALGNPPNCVIDSATPIAGDVAPLAVTPKE